MNVESPSSSPKGGSQKSFSSPNESQRFSDSFIIGGNMHRLLKTVLLVMTFALLGSEAFGQSIPIVQVSGRLPQGNLRVFAKDTLYQVTGHYTVSGTLLIEPGTTVEFIAHSRLIDSDRQSTRLN